MSRTRLTQREAMAVVVRHAARGLVGDGCGIRRGLDDTERDELERAIEIVWFKAYGFRITNNERFNLGMRLR